ncbi:MAG: 3D-(3,5/4)-trihydroxycyclohexane-1,2-dione acylhydrolase (decyclizing) [Fusobacterium sp. JB021]|nr:3D-(3,5/4)-trihydroxycyclohexane-1,2-dione acylhydrolase (decyclizing) [Fusobacterium sp. JB020]MDP0494390.1 3D-(3,5/4)-trihydroxycyclohexane-1,2-dione acylhydrolase (decyclizing) [Fusobacterium sp. JB021]MDP0506742.1 3D-(3,5/4)-trihydroxycyclohexane-1,2-dione acylhydrolase (decyclizing) [Fusobacterium sp. JB019]
MERVKLTMAQALVKFLDNQYIEVDGVENKFVEGIFTIFGHGNVLGLGEALKYTEHSLRVHQGRNEQGMGLAAMGFAKQSNRQKIYACTSSVGPGAMNMVTAAATATANRIPVLFLPGDTYACRQPDPVLQQLEQFHDLSITVNDAFKPVSKYWDKIYRPEQLMTAMINAMRVLTSPRDTGAVTIALPQDVQGEVYEYPVEFFKKRVHTIARTLPADTLIEKAVKLIKSKKNPMLVCGGGVRYSGAGEIFKKFCEKFNIPFGETQAGKSTITHDNDYNLGGMGTTGNLAANLIAQKADLIIGVGTRYTDFTTASKWLFKNKEVEFLNINIGEFDAEKMDGLALIGDAKQTLEKLIEKLDSYKSNYKDEIKDAKNAWEKELERLYKTNYFEEGYEEEIKGHLPHVLKEFGELTGSYLTQTRVLGLLNKKIAKDSVIVGASGSLPGDLQRVWKASVPETYHVEYGFSCMGYEVNAALGAKLAVGDKREVYTMVGDGAYMMLHSELPTSIQEKKKINIILFDNMAFGCINNLQMGHGMESFGTEMRYRDYTTDTMTGELVKMDFAKNAAGYGCKTYTVKTEEELLAALEDSKKQEVSTLIDIKVLPKTMTDGYEAFWRVGNAQVSNRKEVENATRNLEKELKKTRDY